MNLLYISLLAISLILIILRFIFKDEIAVFTLSKTLRALLLLLLLGCIIAVILFPGSELFKVTLLILSQLPWLFIKNEHK